MQRALLRTGLAIAALLFGAVVWLPVLHAFYTEDVAPYFSGGAVPARVEALAARHLRLWEDEALRQRERQRMRRSNAEWDFMGRTFLVLALSNLCLRSPEEAPRLLAVIDQILDDTLDVERTHGMYHFLMPYARTGKFRQQPARSIFVDGEIALMLGARRLVEESDRYRAPFTSRVAACVERMRESPLHCSESYPNECWMFCNAAALVAARMAEVLDGADHGEATDGWLTSVKRDLRHEQTGLLVSAFTWDGTPTHGPEGSTIWFVIQCLRVLDPDFAADQYARARRELGRNILGFGFASEWPKSWIGPKDIDSGAVIPFLDVSAGSSGMAFLGAAGFHDREYLAALLATIDFAGMPAQEDGRLRYCASNQVGDAVLLYSLAQGPLWKRLRRA